jgi:hypothetical protein
MKEEYWLAASDQHLESKVHKWEYNEVTRVGFIAVSYRCHQSLLPFAGIK